jgi:HAD superfamily hydrolase (TIGR01490 family)
MTPRSRVGAFFDIDKTLLPSPSLELRFAEWLIASDLLEQRQIVQWARQALFGFWAASLKGMSRSKGYLAGLPIGVVEGWEASLAAGVLAPFEKAAERLDQHRAFGHRIFLISGTLAPLANLFARQLDGSIAIYATELETNDEIYTGHIKGNHMRGSEKAKAIEDAARRNEIDARKSYAYGNSLDDLAMLECVGNPVAVNTCRKLRRIAATRGWEVIDWKSIEDPDVSRERHFSTTENAR